MHRIIVERHCRVGLEVPPQRRAVEIVPHLNNLDVFADRDSYRAGEQMKLTVDVRAANGKPVPDEAGFGITTWPL